MLNLHIPRHEIIKYVLYNGDVNESGDDINRVVEHNEKIQDER